MWNSGCLPEEMMREVLLRVPVKSLLVCKSVCKPWLSTITNPDFVKSQLHHAAIMMNNPTLLGFEQPPLPQFDVNLGEIVFLRLQRLQRLFEALIDLIEQDLSTTSICIHRIICDKVVIGSCNGILCVVDNFGDDMNIDNDVYLWNPSIRQSKKLPTSPNNCTNNYVYAFGFGYDSISDDYKVTRFFYNLDFGNDRVQILQVYSSTADSWTEFQHPMFQNQHYRGNGIVVNGIMYYATQSGNLVSFDLHTQVLVLVPFPTSIQTVKSDLLDFKGSVAVVFESGFELDLWTLDDVSGKVSWTKRFSIDEDGSQLHKWLTCYLGAGLFFGRMSVNATYVCNFVYDYEKKKTKYYQLGENEIYMTFNYIETLISLDGFEQVQSLDIFCTSGVKWQLLN